MEDNLSSPWLDREEAAQRMKVSPSTIDRWRNSKGLPSSIVGGVTRYHRDRLDEWMLTHEPKQEEDDVLA